MTCNDPTVVRKALVAGLCAIEVGEYRIEYINNAAPGIGIEEEHLALLERRGDVTDIITLDSDFFESLVEHYGAEGVRERY